LIDVVYFIYSISSSFPLASSPWFLSSKSRHIINA
jgi:hypothetical protein